LKQRIIFARIIIAVTVLRAAFSFLSLIAAVTFQLVIIAKVVFKDLSFKTVLSKFVTRSPSKVKDLSNDKKWLQVETQNSFERRAMIINNNFSTFSRE